jgi:WS/DGAT/MGAT family acyltransferase
VADEITYESRMSDADKLMWVVEADPTLRSTITSVAIFDRAPDRARLRERMERASRRVPRLRQRVVGNPFSLAPPRWEVDPHFNLDYHLRWMSAPAQAAEEGTTADALHTVLRLAEPMAMHSFDRARPLWEFVVVEGLEGGRAAMVMKVHHAVTDGVGGVKLMLEVFDIERDPEGSEPLPDAPGVHVMSPAERFMDAMNHERRRGMGIAKRSINNLLDGLSSAASDPRGAGERLGATVTSAARMLRPATQPHSTLMRGRSLSVHFETLTIPLQDTKDAARHAGGKLNDAFVAGLTGGLRRYHEHHGHTDVTRLRMAMPMNVRTAETEAVAGNQFAPTRFDVPLDIEDPVERMSHIRELVAVQRAEPALDLIEPMAAVINRLPREVATGLFGTMLKGVDFTSSNVPGAPFPVYLSGAQLEAQFAFGPMAGAAANITLLSYVDDLNLGINTDPAAIPDPDVFVGCLRDSFNEILKG